VTVVKVFQGIKGGNIYYLMAVVVERKTSEAMVLARLAPALSAGLITGDGREMESGSANAVSRNLGETYCSTWVRVLGG
jgi:hypothetical protein